MLKAGKLAISSSELDDPRSRFIAHLVDTAALDTMAGQRLTMTATTTRQSLPTIILELGLVEERKLTHLLAEYFKLPVANLGNVTEAIALEDQVSPEFLRRARILPVRRDEREITFAVMDPFDQTPVQASAFSVGLIGRMALGVPSEISQKLDELYPLSGSLASDASDEGQQLESVSHDLDRLRDLASEAPVVRLLSAIVAKAVTLSVSDIHIEPLIDQVRVRYRIDGRLVPAEALDRAQQLALTSRIKILARLNIAEQRLPQDGRIRLAVKGREIDFRVSTAPTIYGESVVLRILDRNVTALNFNALGFAPDAETQLRTLLAHPNGIVLVTGPTGSGKTTTLYAGLEILNEASSKIFTVEDPIEYFMKGVNQILVKPQIGLDFADILRSILRQDPDIIMVGEIRDAVTAAIAVQASLTGHLVLSSLHTNTAIGAITRLRNLGIENFLIAATVRGVVAQRLVRRLCPNCKVEVADSSHPKFRRRLFHAKGCPKCNGTGYQGRTVIYEILVVDDNIRQAIEQGCAESEIAAAAQRMVTLQELGRLKVQSGETSREELLRVVEGLGDATLPL